MCSDKDGVAAEEGDCDELAGVVDEAGGGETDRVLGGRVGCDGFEQCIGSGTEGAVAIDSEGDESDGGGDVCVLVRFCGGSSIGGGGWRRVRGEVRGGFGICQGDVDGEGLELVGEGEVSQQRGRGNWSFAAGVDGLQT